MVVTGDGEVYYTELPEIVVGERVHDNVSLKEVLNGALSRTVGLDVVHLGLVGDVEEAALVVAVLLHMLEERGDEGTEEAYVLGRGRVGLPSEDLLVFAVNGSHYLGCVLCSPLSEEVSDLKVLDSDSVAHIHPSVDEVEVEGVFTVLNGYTDELVGESLAAYLGVERRSEGGGEKEVDAVSMSGSCKVLNDLPVLLAPYLYVVVVCEGVAVEPLGEDELLLGEGCVYEVDGEGVNGLYLARLVEHLDLELGLAYAGRVSRDVDIDPE